MQDYVKHQLMVIWKQLNHSILDAKTLIADITHYNEHFKEKYARDEETFKVDIARTCRSLLFEQYIIEIDVSGAEPKLIKFEEDEDPEWRKNMKLRKRLEELLALNDVVRPTVDDWVCEFEDAAVARCRSNYDEIKMDAQTSKVRVKHEHIPGLQLYDWRSGKRPMIMTMDIVGLYPSLSHQLMLQAVDYHWEKHREEMPDDVDKDTVKAMML